MWRNALPSLAALILLLLTNCAAMRADAARREALKASLDQVVWNASPQAVLAQASAQLVEEGYSVQQVAALTLDTQPVERGDATVHVVVSVVPVGNGSRLVAVRHRQRWEQSQSGGTLVTSHERDHELELAILKRTDLARATAIDREARRRAEAAAEPEAAASDPEPEPTRAQAPQPAAAPTPKEDTAWLARRGGVFGGPFLGAGLAQEVGGFLGYGAGRLGVFAAAVFDWHTFDFFDRWLFAGGLVGLRVDVLPVWSVSLAARLTFPLQPRSRSSPPAPDVAAGIEVVPVQFNLGSDRRHELSLAVPIVFHRLFVPVPVMLRDALRLGR